MKLSRFLVIFAFVSFYFLFSQSVPLVHAEPFAPFSVEGNPDEAYYLDNLFPLFRYIRPANLKVFENRDRSRNYENLQKCTFAGADRRDDYCDNDNTAESSCDGGDIDVCNKGDGINPNDPSSVAYTAHSSNGTCKYDKAKKDWVEGEIVTGVCEYKKLPSVNATLKGTDFSAIDRSTPSSPAITSSTPVEQDFTSNPNLPTGLTFHKYQNESDKYSFQGSDNAITWGSQYLTLNQCDLVVKRLLVVKRAKQTKNTVNQTGEWPLGWVDWGYTTIGGKTLIDIHDELPDDISAQGKNIEIAVDTFFLSAGLTTVDYSKAQKIACDAYDKAIHQSPPATWALDLSQSPIYSPSFRQGYSRGSICVWDLCCPGPRCPLPGAIGEFEGRSKVLYYDISVSQAFGAAIDDLLLSYSREEGAKLFNQLAIQNPLVRFATTATVKAIPSEIHRKLSAELSNKCLQYIPGPGDFTLGWFGYHMDYLKMPEFFGPNETCPGYRLQPELTKETGAAIPQTFLSRLIALFWRGGANGPGGYVDAVEPTKYHVLTIPDAMGQSLGEIEDPVYQTRDTRAELEIQNKYNLTLSNIVDGESDQFYAGKGMPVGDAKRRLAYFTCNDDMYSSPQDTSIEAYALGTRIGCDQAGSDVPAGKCDGQLFAKLIESGKYQNTSAKGQAYFDANIKGNLTPDLMNTYAAAEKETGVPCEILAGIHFVEAGNNPTGSLVSGRQLGTAEPDAGGKIFRTLLDTAVYAGKELQGKVGGNLKDVNTIITALSRYNGGGNSNCQLGYPYKIPYGGCPRLFEGEDDPYPTSFLDGKHDAMYLLYCADRTACVPQVFERPGSFTVALNVYNSITKNGYEATDLPTQQQQPAARTSASPNNSGSSGFFPKSCSAGSLSTALGCIPYTREAFVSALLTFVVGIAGAIALITMLIATFQIMTAGSNPEQLKKGKELFTSAVIGLLFLIFSVTLLRLFAGSIIKLPGF